MSKEIAKSLLHMDLENFYAKSVDMLIGNPPFDSLDYQKLRKIHVRYPRWTRIFSKMEYIRSVKDSIGEPYSLLIIGESGVGKSTLIEQYVEKHPPRNSVTGKVVPVLCARVPRPTSIKSLVERLLQNLGDPFCGKGTTTSMTNRLYSLVAKCGVELIVLDEFQHFIDAERDKVLSHVADWLKDVINNTKIPIVLVGVPECTRVLKVNAQLARRFSAMEVLSPFEWAGDRKDEFKKFLGHALDQVPLKNTDCLRTAGGAQRMFWASEGRVAIISKILKKAVQVALWQQREVLTLEDLAFGYEEEVGAVDGDDQNPFVGEPPQITAWGRPVRSVIAPSDPPGSKSRKNTSGKPGKKGDFSAMTSPP